MVKYSSVVYTNSAYAASLDVIAMVDAMAKNTISHLMIEVSPSEIVMSDDRKVPEQTKKIMIGFLDKLLGHNNYSVNFDLLGYEPKGVTYTKYVMNR